MGFILKLLGFEQHKQQTILFKLKYFSFKNRCLNFTIRKGIKDNFYINEWVNLTSDFGYWGGNLIPRDDKKAIIRYVQIIRFKDINSFKYWHLSELSDKAPIDIMKDIYGEHFSENEIVTVIWFMLMPEAITK